MLARMPSEPTWTEQDVAAGLCPSEYVGHPRLFWTRIDVELGYCKPEQFCTAKPPRNYKPEPALTEQLAATEAAIKDGKLPSAREEYQKAFHLMGGTEALAKWAQANPEKFYALHSKLMPQTVEGEVNHKVAVLQLSWLVARNTEGDLVTVAPATPAASLPPVAVQAYVQPTPVLANATGSDASEFVRVEAPRKSNPTGLQR